MAVEVGQAYPGVLLGSSKGRPIYAVFAGGNTIQPGGSLTVIGWQTVDFNTTPIAGSPITEIDLGVEFANCTTSGATFVISIFDAGIGIQHGLVTVGEQKFQGLKVLEDGFISGTNQDDGFFLEFAVPNAGGAGYVVGDVLTFVGGTLASGGSATQVQVTSVGGGGSVTAVKGTNPGLYTIVPANSISVTGGTGAAATIDATWLGNAIGKFFLASPAGSSIGSAPYCAWGDWSNTTIYQAYANATPQSWKLTVPHVSSGQDAILEVQSAASGTANVIANASGNIGVFGSRAGGGALHSGQTGAISSGATAQGGIIDSLGTANLGFDVAAHADFTGQTAARNPVTSFTPGALGTYRISGYVTITAVATDVLNFQVTYTDETNTSRTQILAPQGTTSVALGATGSFVFPAINIRSKSGVAITIAVTLAVGTGSVTYDCGGVIEHVS